MIKIKNIILYLIGLFLIIIGTTFLMLYSELFLIGYSLKEFVLFIFKRVEFLSLFPGIIIISYVVWKGKK